MLLKAHGRCGGCCRAVHYVADVVAGIALVASTAVAMGVVLGLAGRRSGSVRLQRAT